MYERRIIPDFPNYEITKDGKVYGPKNKYTKPLSGSKNQRNVETVILRKDGKAYLRGLNKLVRDTWGENLPDHNSKVQYHIRLDDTGEEFLSFREMCEVYNWNSTNACYHFKKHNSTPDHRKITILRDRLP